MKLLFIVSILSNEYVGQLQSRVNCHFERMREISLYAAAEISHSVRNDTSLSRDFAVAVTNMSSREARLNRERHTIQTMIQIYCRGNHDAAELCAECAGLSEYAMQRIDKCPFQDDKPTCAKCPIHCYKPDMRERVRRVMRYAGPRMMLFHPVLTFRHYYDEYSRKQLDKKIAIEKMRARESRK